MPFVEKQSLSSKYSIKDEMNYIYIMNSIRSFALSLISIFIPIYLIKNGFSIMDVCVYLILFCIFGLFLAYGSLRVCSKYGVKYSIIASVPFMVIFFILLYNITYLISILDKYVFILLISFFYTISVYLYAMGFHVEFARFSESNKSMKQVGTINVLSIVFSIIGPLVGSLIIVAFSFKLLFIFIMIFLLISVIPVFLIKRSEKISFNFDDIKSIKVSKDMLAFIGEGAQDFAAGILWPLLLFYMMISVSEIGLTYTISYTIVVIFTILIGKIATNDNKRLILRIGLFIHSMTLIARVFLRSIWSIIVVQGIGGFSWAMMSLPFSSMFYNNSKKEGIAKYVFFREFSLIIGRMLLMIIFIVLLLMFDVMTSLMITIIIGAFLVLLMNLLNDKDVS